MTLLKFEANWCAPCKTMTAIMKGMDYTPVDIETEDGENLAITYGVRSIPTLILVADDGEVVSTSIGVKSRHTLDKWLAEDEIC